jgi:hypothetical protein
MAVTLNEAAVLSEDDLQRGVLETFVQESVVLDRIPFLGIQGNAYAYNKEASLPGVEFRNVNEAYTESTGTVNQASESLVILGGDADVDRFIVQTRGNLNDQRAIQTGLKVKALTYKFQDHFVNGDVATEPKGFDGLKKRLTGSQVLTSTGPILDPADTNVAQAFFDELEELLAAVKGGADVLYTNRAVIARVKSAGRRLGGVEMVREDLTGKRVVTWNGIPLLDLGQKPDGSDIIPLDEDPTATDGGTSIYAVKFGTDEHDFAVTGLENGGVQVRDLGEQDEKPVYRTRIEFYCGLGVFGGKAAARLTGVLNA